MEDLGFPEEPQIDYFRCVEKPHVIFPSFVPPPPPRSSLLAVSSRYANLFRADGACIYVHALKLLRENTEGDAHGVRVDLRGEGVQVILGLWLVLDDKGLMVHYSSQKGNCLIVFSVAGVIRGKVVWMAGVSAAGDVISAGVGGGEKVCLLLESGVLMATLEEGVDAKCVDVDETALKEAHAFCVGLSPDDELLAIGVGVGSVYLYETESMNRRAEIVVVESGWVPFSVAFVTEEDVMVSYASGDMTNHVVWTIGEDEGEISVKSHSMLGELCFPMLNESMSEEEGHDSEGERVAVGCLPIMFRCPVPGWKICVVGSSLSVDIEVIAKREDGVWEIWKFDEGKSAVLPTDDEGKDANPLGIAFDLTDTAKIDAMDPSAPSINPMPRVLALTTGSRLVPFALIDDRAGAVCDAVRKALPVPDVPEIERPVKKEPILVEKKVAGEDMASKGGEAALFGSGSFKAGLGRSAIGAFSASTPFATVGGFGFGPKKTPSAPNDYMPLTGMQSEPSPFRPGFALGMQESRGTEELSSDEEDNDTDEEDIGRVRTATHIAEHETPQESLDSVNAQSAFPKPEISFSGTENFLSKFEFVGISDQESAKVETFPSSNLSKSFERIPQAQKQNKTVLSSTVSSVTLPAYPPQPSFEEVSAAVNRGKPEDLIRSMLIEMKQELDYNGEAASVAMKRVEATNESLMPVVGNVKSGLNNILQDMRNHFRVESGFRRDVLDSLKEMMARSRDYENMFLEFRIREDEGFSQGIRSEDKIIDEQISKKEMSVTKSLAAVENRIHKERVSKDQYVSQTERIQQMYSSLSLQGIRIRRVCTFLSALSARVDQLEEGGRRSDLGLSMARLEKMSLGEQGKVDMAGHDAVPSIEGIDSVPNRAGHNVIPVQGLDMAEMGEDTCTASKDVLTVLRRLAMRNGRANIAAKSSKPQFKTPETGIRHSEVVDPGDIATVSTSATTGQVTSPNYEDAYNISTAILHQDGVSSSGLGAQAGFTSMSSVDKTGMHAVDIRSSTPTDKRKFSISASSSLKRNSDIIAEDTSPALDRPDKTFTSFRPNHKRLTEIQAEASLRMLTKPPLFGREKEVRFATWQNPVAAKEANSGFHLGKGDVSTQQGKDGDSLNTGNSGFRSTTASLLPNDVQRQSRQSLTSNSAKNTAGSFASIPPDDVQEAKVANTSSADAEVASLSPDDVIKSSVYTVLTNEEMSKGGLSGNQSSTEYKKNTPAPTVAALPPDDDIRSNLSAQLPPDEYLGSKKVAFLPPDENVSKRVKSTLPPGENQNAGLVASLPPDDKSSPCLQATLPPDDIGKNSLVAVLSPDNSQSNNLFGSVSQSSPTGNAQQLNASEVVTDKESPINKTGLEQSGNSFSFGPGFTDAGTSATPSLFGAVPSKSFGEESKEDVGTFTRNRYSPDHSGEEKKQQDPGSFGMDMFALPQVTEKVDEGFGTSMSPEQTQSQQSMGVFGSTIGNNSTSSGFGLAMSSSFSNTPKTQDVFGEANNMQDGDGGSLGPASTPGGGNSAFPSIAQPASAFSSLGGSYGSTFGSTTQFGEQSHIQSGGAFGSAAAGSGGSQFGMNSSLRPTAQFGASAQLGAGFGGQSQIGSGQFNIPPVAGSSMGFSSGGGQAPAFGNSVFGQSIQTFGGASNSFGSGNPSPFGIASGESTFGGQSSGGSGFAALAATEAQQAFRSSTGSGFGNSSAPVFGSNNGPPAFTSAAFSERRA